MELKIKKAIVNLDVITPKIYVVIRIEKTVRGVDIDTSVEPYLKWNSMKEKPKQKIDSEINNACARLSNYREPFAWSALCIFTSGKIIEGETQVYFKKEKPVLGDEELITHLLKTNTDFQKKTNNVLPIFMKLCVKLHDVNAKLENCLDPSISRMIPFNNEAPPLSVIKKLQNLHESSHKIPFTTCYSYLYVNLHSLNFSKSKATRNLRNLTIKVKVLDSDSDINKPGLPVNI